MKEQTMAYGRRLLLEGQLPHLAREKEDTRREKMAAQRALSQKKLEWEYHKKPGFFQRLLGKTEEKQEAAYRACREAEADLRWAEEKEQAALRAYQAAEAEMDALAAIPAPAEVPLELALEAFAPAVLDSLDRCLKELEYAQQLTRDLVAVTPNGREEEKMDCFARARAEAGHMKAILEHFPEKETWISGYLQNPDGFLLAAATSYARRDRLNTAVGQLYQLKKKLNPNT